MIWKIMFAFFFNCENIKCILKKNEVVKKISWPWKNAHLNKRPWCSWPCTSCQLWWFTSGSDCCCSNSFVLISLVFPLELFVLAEIQLFHASQAWLTDQFPPYFLLFFFRPFPDILLCCTDWGDAYKTYMSLVLWVVRDICYFFDTRGNRAWEKLFILSINQYNNPSKREKFQIKWKKVIPVEKNKKFRKLNPVGIILE